MVIKKQATGRLNVDASPSIIPAGDFTNAENVRFLSTRAGDVTEIDNVEGNRRIKYGPVDGRFSHEVIGTYEDRANNRVYYFVWGFDVNQNRPKHKILCFDGNTELITKLVHDGDITGTLNFDRDSYVASSYAGGVLYFTDDVNPPRKIEVDRILSGDFVVQDVNELLLAPSPGIRPLTVRKANAIEEGVDFNNTPAFNAVAEESFQFSYRYVYTDNSVSVLSTYSDAAFFNNDDDSTTEEEDDVIIVQLPEDEEIPRRVKRVEFCYRVGNTGSWFSYETFDGDDLTNHGIGSPLTSQFFNQKVSRALSDEYSTKLFDQIPQKAKALDIAQDRLFLGNIEIGYDTPSVSRFAASQVVEEVPDDTTGQTYLMTYRYLKSNGVTALYNHVFLVLVQQGLAQDGWYIIEYDFDILERVEDDVDDIPNDPDDPFDTGGYTRPVLANLNSLKFLGTDVPTAEVVNNNIVGQHGIDADVVIEESLTIDTVYQGGGGDGIIPVTFEETQTLSTDNGRHFKAGGRYRIGIVFHDITDQSGGVYTNDNSVVDIPFRPFEPEDYVSHIRWSASGNDADIPEWATHYRIVRTKNLITDFFIQVPFNDFRYVDSDPTGLYTLSETNEGSNSMIAISAEAISNEGLGYSYNEGDICYIYLQNGSRYKTSILGQIGKYIIIEQEDVLNFLENTDLNSVQIKGILDVYNPVKQTDQEVFYEIGLSYPVLNPGTDARSWSVTNGNIPGDVFLKNRRIPFTPGSQFGVSAECEAMSVNDRKWSQWVEGIGRPSLIIADGGFEDLPNRVLYSNKFIQSSNVNGLSSFDLLDRFDIDERTGEINSLMYTSSTNNSENILLAIGANNTSSVYIGQTRVIDDSGAAILATSGSVVGTINTLKGNHGTVNPESVVLSRAGRVFFYDKNNNAIVRYSSNGLYPISQFGINSDVPTFSRDAKFPAGFDNRHDELLLKIKTTPSGPYPFLEDYSNLQVALFVYNSDIGNLGIPPEATEVAGTNVFPYADLLLRLEPNYTYQVVVTQTNDDVSVLLNDEQQVLISGGGTHELSVDKETNLNVILTGPAYVRLNRYRIDSHQFISPTEKSLCYHDATEGFVGARLFAPEAMTALNDAFMSFLDGSLYVHDSTRNNFYGEQHDSLIAFVYNEPDNYVKVPRGVFIEARRQADEVHLSVDERYKQSSDIIEFRRNETVWYADVKRDRLTPGFDEFEGALLHGETLRGSNIFVWFKWDGSEPIKCEAMHLRVQASDGHPLINR